MWEGLAHCGSAFSRKMALTCIKKANWASHREQAAFLHGSYLCSCLRSCPEFPLWLGCIYKPNKPFPLPKVTCGQFPATMTENIGDWHRPWHHGVVPRLSMREVGGRSGCTVPCGLLWGYRLHQIPRVTVSPGMLLPLFDNRCSFMLHEGIRKDWSREADKGRAVCSVWATAIMFLERYSQWQNSGGGRCNFGTCRKH